MAKFPNLDDALHWLRFSARGQLITALVVIGTAIAIALITAELISTTTEITVLDKHTTQELVPVRVTTRSTNTDGKTITRDRIRYEYEYRYWITTPTETLETNSSEWLQKLGISASYETLQENHRYSVQILPWFGRRFLRRVEADLGPMPPPATPLPSPEPSP
ncbi:MAG: hypothetical protein MH825_02775 [Cyanobacteria bacterium]|nr:hypothetical protein [Cyanobacteriota bacterium]